MNFGARTALMHQLMDPLSKELPGLLKPLHLHGLDVLARPEFRNGFHLNQPHMYSVLRTDTKHCR
jgi:hypothetical protein